MVEPGSRSPLEVAAAVIASRAGSSPRLLVSIDGPGAVGKTTFTAALADRLRGVPVVVLHGDDFLRSPELRHRRGRLSAEGFWLDAFDHVAMTEVALDPLRRGDDRYRRTPDAEPQPAPPRCVVLVEGVFLLREDLRRFWEVSVHLQAPPSVIVERMIRRGTVASPRDPRLERYLGAHRLYEAEARPASIASIVVDNTCFEHPRLQDLRL